MDVYQDLRTARVQFIGGDDLSAIFPDPIHSAEEAITALRRVRSLLGVANPSEEFVAGNAQSNGEIFSYKLQQTYRGVPVYSEEIVVATDPDGMIHTLASTYQPIDGSLSATPDLTRDDAETIARNALESEIAAARDDAPSVNITLSSELVVYAPDGRAPELSWRVTAYDTWIAKDYFINQSGIIVDSFSLLCGAAENVAASGVDDLGVSRAFRSSKVSDDKFELFDMERKIKTYGINNPSSTATLFTSANNTWSDRVAVSAHYNTAVVYDFYKNILNRTSIDGAGMEIKSTVHLNEDNAWWHPVAKQMFYGDGITTFRPLARGMDVVGHELTHGVIQHTPANLTYISESGALNEAYADILGNLIEGKTGADAWLLGEDVTLATAALRDMANPTRFGQPMEVSGDHYWNPQNTSWDNGGVHRNSGIINRAAYLMWSDGHFTREEFAKLWYSSLSLMTSNSKFIHCKLPGCFT